MRRTLISVCIILIAIAVLAVVLPRLRGPSMLSLFPPAPSPDEMYPPAPAMPPVISTPVADLLSQYEAFLKSKAPSVLSALQPGLTDSEIDALERQHGVKLTADLRALYRWRNGTPRGANIDTFPNHEFVPLDVAFANRDELRKQVRAGTPEQQQVYAAFAGHTDEWLGLIIDVAGDGHFFDPSRSESQGSFFFCFAEDGSYVFYPAFRNYLAAVVDGQKAGVFVAGSLGIETADFENAQELWQRYGAALRR